MRSEELDFPYPDSLVALERAQQSRVMLVAENTPRELGRELGSGVTDLIDLCRPGDLLVVNDTRVLPRRVFTEEGLEVLFLRATSSGETATQTTVPLNATKTTVANITQLTTQLATDWQVLCPATRWKNATLQTLPCGLKLELIARGKPQTVRVLRDGVPFALNENYFSEYGDLPLPPYIQKARGERRNRSSDSRQYQTAWAEIPGSLAAPTASFHFQNQHLDLFRAKGGKVAKITLHVGLGTFLPVTAESLDEHVMHAESVEISPETWRLIRETKASGARVWCLGTTVTRALEAAAHGHLKPLSDGGWYGETDLFIKPGFEFQIVDVLCTNFHQPKSTLLALTAAFAGLENVKRSYHWAIENKFRLFSYGDLSVWLNP